MNAESLKEAIRREYADQVETRDRFHELLAELRQDRKWDERQMAMREEFRLVYEEIIAQAKKFDRSIVISPMIDARAHKVAEQLGIETFGDSLDVKML